MTKLDRHQIKPMGVDTESLLVCIYEATFYHAGLLRLGQEGGGGRKRGYEKEGIRLSRNFGLGDTR